MFIDGTWETGAGVFDVYNPATGETVGQVADGSRADVQRAISAASQAFPAWSGLTAYARSEMLYRAWQLMCERREELARVMTLEQGKPLKAASNEVGYAADFLLWFAEEAKRVYGRTVPAPRPDQRFIVLHQPVGVVAAITPWNYPVSMITRKVAPALAAGCTVVLKPSEATPLCAVEVFKILQEAGLPDGVVNLVTARDPEPIGREFVENRLVKKITFTGSTEIGKILARRAAAQVKRISMELGGHAPFIVLDDADPIRAAKGCLLVKFLNTGQACISPNRLLVHRAIVEPFTAELRRRAAAMKAGSGFDSDVRIGPLMNRAALDKVERQVADAIEKGAIVETGGMRLMDDGLDRGFFYAPTVLNNVTPDMTMYREETFGPVAPISGFDTDAEALAMANDTDYGLAAYIYTQNISRAMHMLEGLRFAIVGINDINPTAAAAPFGGMQESGLGREGGIEGIAEYLEVKLAGFSI